MNEELPMLPAEDEHNAYGPSALKDYEQCNAFVPQDDSKRDPYMLDLAREGSFQHRVIEEYGKMAQNCGVRDPIPELADLAWERAMASDQGVEFESPGAEDTARKQCWLVIQRTHRLIYPDDGRRCFFELRLDVGGLTYGTGDLVVLHSTGTTASLADHKFGWVDVDPPQGNAQAWAYVLGAFTMFPDLVAVDFCFFQPKVDMDTEPFPFHRDMVPVLTDRVARAVSRARSGRDPAFAEHAVGEVCTHCDAIGTCPEFRGELAKAGRSLVFDTRGETLEWPEDFSTPENRGKAMLFLNLIEKAGKDLKDELLAMAQGGQGAEGYKIIDSKSKQTVPAKQRETAFREAIGALFGEELGPQVLAHFDGLEDKDRRMFLSAVDLVPGKLPGPVYAKLKAAELIGGGKEYSYLKRISK